MTDLELKLKLAPELDVASLNAMLNAIKKSMGPLGKDIKPIDGKALAEELKKVEQEIVTARKETEGLTTAMDGLGKKGGDLEKAFKFNQITQGVTTLANSVTQLSAPFLALDTATQKIKTLGGDAAKLADTFREGAVKLSTEIPVSASDIQSATYEALSAGIKATESDIATFMEASGKLAVGGGETIGSAVNILSSQLNAYGLAASEAGKTSDILFNTINVGKTSLPELVSGLANVVPTASAAGVELENVGGALALMTAKGIPTAQSTTKLNQLLIELQKPGATLAPILQKAGVSLESLRNDDLPVTLRKVSDAMKEVGTNATLTFSSTEASAAFNTLAGDLDTFDSYFGMVRDGAGSTQFAYEKMADSVENRSQQILNVFDNLVTTGVGALGESFVTLTTVGAKVAPTLTTIAQIKNLVPESAVDAVKDFAISIASKLIPSIGAQAVATGAATTAQTTLNLAMLANPAFLVVAGIVALGAAVKVLSDLLHESAEEQLAENQVTIDLLETQKKTTQARFDQVASQDKLLASYKALSETENRTAQQEEQLRKVAGELAITYGGAVDASKSYAENQQAIADVSEQTQTELATLGAELFNLDKQLEQARVLTLSLEADVSKEELESTLADSFGDGYFDSIGRKILSGNPLGAVAEVVTAGFSDEISEFFTGTSSALQASEGFVKSFSDKVYGAQSQAEISKAAAEFATKVAIDGEKMGISKEEQAKAIKQFNDFAGKRIAALEAQKEAEKNITDAQVSAISSSFVEIIEAGGDLEGAAEKIGKAFNISKEKAKELAAQGGIKKLSEDGKLATASVEDLAKKYGLPKDQIQKMIDKQKELTAEVSATGQSVDQLGAGFQKALSDQNEAIDKGVTNLGALYAKLRDQQKKGSGATKAQIEETQRLIKTQEDELRQKDKLRDSDEDALKRAKELVDPPKKKDKAEKSVFEKLKAQYELQKEILDTATRQDNIDANSLRISEKRKKTTEDEIAEQDRLYTNAEESLKKFKEQFLTESGEFVPTLKEKDLDNARKMFQDLQFKVQDEKLKLEEVKLKLDPAGLEEKMRELFMKQLRAQVEAGTQASSVLIEELSKDLTKVEADLLAVGDTTSEERVKLLEKQNAITEEIKKIRLDGGKKLIQELEKQRKEQLENEDEANADLIDKYDAMFSALNAKADIRISTDTDTLLEDLEKTREQELISQEDYEKRKEEIQKQSADRQKAYAKLAEGEKLAIETASQAERLKSEIEFLKKKREILEQSGDTAGVKELDKQLSETEDLLAEKGDNLGVLMETLSGSLDEGFKDLFSGDLDAVKDNMKNFLSLIVGFLEKLVSAAIVELVLGSEPLKALASTFGFAAPAILAGFIGLIGSGVRAIVNPILGSISSFATGAVFTKPTLAMVGDAQRLGGDNMEVLLRNTQIQAIIDEASRRQDVGVIQAIAILQQAVEDLQFRLYVAGEDLTTATNRHRLRNQRRNRGLVTA